MLPRLGLLLVLLAGARAGVAEAATPKVGVVDIEAVMNATDHWKKVRTVLEKDRTEKQAKLEAKQKELKDKKDKLDAQKAVSDPKIAAAKEEELYKEAQDLTQGFMKTQQELVTREKKVNDQMLTRIEAIVRDIAAQDDLDFVFEKGGKDQPNVLFAPKKNDLTQKVVDQYNKRFKDKPLEL